jgi:hypothetical protein
MVKRPPQWLSEKLRPAFAAAAIMAFPAPAAPHTHIEPDGTAVTWYPRECCNDGDCRPVVRIEQVPDGLWMTLEDGYVVQIGPKDKRRRSLDARWHICLTIDGVDNITPIIHCIFEPANS